MFGFRLHILDEFKARETASEIIQTLNPNLGYKDWMQTHGNLYQAIKLSKTLVILLMLMLVGVEYQKIVPSTDPNVTMGMALGVFLLMLFYLP